MRSPDFDNLNSAAPSLRTIRNLKDLGWIKPGSPNWWSTDYAPDPRKYLTFDDFQSKLVYLGQQDTVNREFAVDRVIKPRQVYLYPNPQVPMTVLEIKMGNHNLPFLITARPYHPKEIFDNPITPFIQDHPLSALPRYLSSGGKLEISSHFYPHIRGLFAGKRGNHLFWYPLFTGAWWKEFGQPLKNALIKQSIDFLEVYNPPYSQGDSTFTHIWEELSQKGNLVDQRRPTTVDFPTHQTSAEEFLENWQDPDKKEPTVVYPLRHPDFKYTLSLVITAKTNRGNNIRKPVILGILAENGGTGYTHIGGICRIKNKQLAEDISGAITADFGTQVDTVLFIPQKGRPKYERISAATQAF